MYLELKHQGNVMQAGAPLRLHSPREGEGGLGSVAEQEAASSALLPGCLPERKRVEILING